MKKIDARGLSCPEPVVLTRKAAKAGEKEIEITVDNICAVENITRYGTNNGFSVDEAGTASEEWVLTLKKN